MKNTVSKTISPSKTYNDGVRSCKDLVIRHQSKYMVEPFSPNKNDTNSSTTPVRNSPSRTLGYSSKLDSKSLTTPNIKRSLTDFQSDESIPPYGFSQRLFPQKEFNAMLEFQELRLDEVENNRSSNQASEEPDVYEIHPNLMSEISEASTLFELTQSQFQAAQSRSRLSNIGNSLYELSLRLRTIDDVRKQVLYFRENAPLKCYDYSCVSDLLLIASKCPPDMPYFLLTMAAKMVKTGNIAPQNELKFFIHVTETLIYNPQLFFVSFLDNQAKPQRKLRKMLALFKQKLAANEKGKSGHLTTSQLEKFLELKQRQQQQKKNYFQEERYVLYDDGILIFEYVKQVNEEAVNKRKRTCKYCPHIEIDEKATIRFDIDPDLYTKEEQRSYCFIKELNDGIEKPKRLLLQKFLSSNDNLFTRRKRGQNMFNQFQLQEIKRIHRLSSLFISWDSVYNASLSVWEFMKEHEDFDVEALLSQLSVSFADFLVEALKAFAQMEGTFML